MYTIMHKPLIYILVVYVDDCILVGKQGPFIINFKNSFSSRFLIKELGPVSWLLGFKILRDRPRRILRISQDQYIADILEDFGMSNATVAGTHMTAKQSTDVSTNNLLDTKLFPFAKLIGKLLQLHTTGYSYGGESHQQAHDLSDSASLGAGQTCLALPFGHKGARGNLQRPTND